MVLEANGTLVLVSWNVMATLDEKSHSKLTIRQDVCSYSAPIVVHGSIYCFTQPQK